MTVSDKIDQDLKEAMLAKNEERVSVLRLLKSAIKNAEIAKKEQLNDSEVLSVLERQAKQRQDAIEQYTNGNRLDLADKEKAELDIVETYLPDKMPENELKTLIDETISTLEAVNIADMGKVIKEVLAKTAGAADGKTVSEMVRKKLS